MSKILWGISSAHSSTQNAGMVRAVEADEWVFFRCAVFVLLIAMSTTVVADDASQSELILFEIPQQRADSALTQFAEQADLTLFFPFDEVRERTANRLVGEHQLEKAIGILLAGTGLKPTFSSQVVLNIAVESQSNSEGDEMSIKKTAGLGVFLAAIFSVSAGAQESADSNEGQKAIEEITVTGSRIARKDLSSVGPITIIGAPEIAATGITSLEVLLQQLPSSAGFGGNRTAAYWVPNGWATAQINLRGMGINRTLVLLNGRRVVSGGTGANFSVDLNMIPVSIIERVEVLKDGASAVYGADAVAGVVNIITKQEFEGVEASIKLGAAFEGDAEELLLDLTWGVTNDRGSLMANLSFQSLSQVFMPDRTGCALAESGGQRVC